MQELFTQSFHHMRVRILDEQTEEGPQRVWYARYRHARWCLAMRTYCVRNAGSSTSVTSHGELSAPTLHRLGWNATSTAARQIFARQIRQPWWCTATASSLRV